jgi:hypothetical protein
MSRQTLDVVGAVEPVAGSTGLPWGRLVRLAIVATVVTVVIVLVDVDRTGRNPVNILQAGEAGPSAAVIHTDFPDVELPSGLGLDGQQYYAIARDPLHLDVAARSLDRPAYRLQRPLLPWLARMLHPTGAGTGLVLAFVLVGVAALVLGGVAAGALSHALGGGIWPALVFPLLPGAYESLRVTVSDALALALALAALAFAAHRRTIPAVAAAILAVLAKETALVVLIGWALGRRDRRSIVMAGAGLATAALWAVWLRIVLPTGGAGDVSELGLPGVGFVRAMSRHWLDGTNRLGMVATLSALIAAALALTRRRGHVLSAALALNLLFVSLMNSNVLGLDFGGTRSTMPLLALALITLASGNHGRVETARSAHSAAGRVGPGDGSGE